ncbi:hypothetical protein [Paenibacillus sp. ALJ109b]|nr:hypothetical protein [Paenibacillus sp. ALJ109b]
MIIALSSVLIIEGNHSAFCCIGLTQLDEHTAGRKMGDDSRTGQE